MDAIEARYEDPEMDLEQIFGELQGQRFKVQVIRQEPDWAKGTLGTFDFDEGEEITTDWLVNKFGGRKLQIKVMTSDSKYWKSKRVTFPKPPKEDGIELVEGPNGSPIKITQQKPETPPPPPVQDSMNGLLKGVLEMQTQQANQMQTLMMTLLTKTLESPPVAQHIPAPPQQLADPQSHLRSTLETFKLFEEAKGIFGGAAEGAAEEENPLIGKIMEKMIEKFAGEPQQQNPQAQQMAGMAPQQNRALPPGPIAPPEPDDATLAMMVSKRLKTMEPEERAHWANLLSHDLEEEEEETPANAGLVDEDDLESLLTQEDIEALQNEEETPQEPPENQQDEGAQV